MGNANNFSDDVNRNLTLFLIGVILVLVLGLLIAPGSFNDEGLFVGSLNSGGGNNGDQVLIGAIFPLSGQLAYTGEYMLGGTEIAIKKINSLGGINGKNMRIIYEDSQSDTAPAVSSYQKISQVEGTKIYLTTLSGATMGIAPIAEKNKDVLLNIGSASTKISDAGEYVFRHNLMPKDEIIFLAGQICNNFNYKEIILLYVNAEAGVSYKKLFEQEYAKCGKIIMEETYALTDSDFKTQLSKIKQSKAKAVLAITYSKEAGTIFNQAKELGINVQWFGVYSIEGASLIEVAGKNAEGLIYTSYPIDANSKEYLEFKQEFINKYEKEPEAYSILAFDSVLVLAEAIKHCINPNDSVCVKNELYKIKNFKGLTGEISFDSNGDTKKTIILKTVKNGNFVPYEKE